MALPALGLTGPFLLFGALGLLWLALWLLLVPGDASGASVAPSASAASAASGADIGGQLEGKQKMQGGVGASGSRVTVWQLLSHPASWAIIIANAVNNWGYFILLSWMPLYFNQVLHTDIRQAAWFSAGPWAVMAGIGLLAAELANRMEGRQGMTRTAVRQVMQAAGFLAPAASLLLLTRMATGPLAALSLTAALLTAGFLGPAASLLLLTRMTTAPLAALCLTAALGLSAFSQAGWLLNHKVRSLQPPSPQGLSNTAGTLAGITSTVATGFMLGRIVTTTLAPPPPQPHHPPGLSNTAGTLAGITSTVATGFMVEQLGSFHAVLTVTAALYVLATAFWLAYATADVVFP
ncbi:unnamed protein product [Closterium sp. Naga37s-1]|nr:unnamed protein product [Closterium sp. Naga37s-1]